MGSYAKSWPSAACRDCRTDTPREFLTKVPTRSGSFNVCPVCLAKRKILKIAPFEKSHEMSRARQALSVD